MKSAWLKDFENPGSAYRGKPFWAWNGKLDPEELRRQIRVMHRMGLGGFFMHSRVGLDTPYLSDEWFDCVNACIDEAKQLDMEAWLYDEDRWPSGAAGGLVTKNPKYRQRELRIETFNTAKAFRWDKAILAAFTTRIDGTSATDIKRLPRGRKPRLAKGESIAVLRVHVATPSSWYNGCTYLDTLSHEAVREFIRVTHEAYRKHNGDEFGKTIPGIFTDEPNHGRKAQALAWLGDNASSMPWTDKLPQTFRKRYGYDLIPHLLEIFFDVDGEGVTPARYHYHDCVTHLFVDAFSRQIGEWCEKNDLEHTGHVLLEDSLACQTNVVGSCLRFYEYMQAPGMDLLTERNRHYDTAKQVSSAARQFGRKWRLTETYGCTGWDFPFLGHKALGDWQAALGINLRCQHLSWYTMGGQAKRDYPAGIFYQSPWWEFYDKVESYFARIHAAMTRGEEVRDLLVVHPVESMWLKVRIGWHGNPEVWGLNNAFRHVRDDLLGANIDFDYGDEEMMDRHARVLNTKDGPRLRLGKAVYKTVLVPPMQTMRASTLKLLKRFRDKGGLVVFAGEAPAYVDAVASADPRVLADECVTTPPRGKRLVKTVESSCRRVSITDTAGKEIQPALHLLREDKDAFYLFLCNTGHDWKDRGGEPRAVDRRLAFEEVAVSGFPECTGAPLELDPDTGAEYAAEAKKSASGWTIRTSLPALGSRLFVIPKRKTAGKHPRRPSRQVVRKRALKPKRWDITLSEANALVLDRCAYRIGNGKWMAPGEILKVDFMVRDALGVQRRGGSMTQPWAREKKKHRKSTPVALRYRFDVKDIPSGECALALEQPGRYRIALNGHALDPDSDAGWWVDQSLRRLPLDPNLLRPGVNELLLECEYDEDHPGLEIVYLLGDFGVALAGHEVTVTAPPSALRLGDWCKQGLAFYSGNVAYRTRVTLKPKRGERVCLQVPDYRGVGVRVLLDGQPLGVIAWEPNEIDITDALDGKPHDLAIEVLGHRRNSHGPLHQTQKWPHWTGPAEFVTDGDRWQDDYQLVPCGLMKAPSLLIRK